ncbi:hypothetical protein DLJ53_03685 [Acuticoccus sediminis]|uniref:AB hydrolase-1 domain-containing protein n=1 Tax=Acuticoccus sediminis TaxID=2184697 RepID=A0A8B2NXN4_9HYPH|nr:alpha/beta hydrolase [Acuticoccus sediminis]RAI03601.1 hypothetical protein DLJ53_03685 [Acuticoccus sediminis]
MAGPPPEVVFLHAVTRDRSDFDELRAKLDVPTLALDLPGHGDGPRTAPYVITEMARTIRLPDGPPPVLYGHSLGGCVALALAAQRPGAIRGLVLEDPPLFAFDPNREGKRAFYRGFVKLKEQMEGPFAGYDEAAWAAEVAGWGSGHGKARLLEMFGPEAVRRRGHQLATFDSRVLDGLIDLSIGAGFDPMAFLSALDVPVTLIAGDPEHSSVLAAEEVRRIDTELDIEVVQIRGEGHFVHEVLPEPCLAPVRALITTP